jgi:hypothetical protein
MSNLSQKSEPLFIQDQEGGTKERHVDEIFENCNDMVADYLPPKAIMAYSRIKDEICWGGTIQRPMEYRLEEPSDYLDHPERQIIKWSNNLDKGWEGAFTAASAADRDT